MNEAALLDEAMLAWFPPSGTVELSTQSTFTETDLRGISDLLYRSGKHSWSRIPRIYTTLRLINELEVIDAFLSCGITDLSLPFGQRTLPGQLKDQSSRVRFLDVQSRVLTKALDIEKEKSKHRHFSNPDDLLFKKVAELGKGGYGFVDKVLSTVSYREYARKLIPRGRTFRQDRDVLRNFENELQVLKKLSHRHIVRLIGSYTDPHYVGVLMDPVADCNLKVLLSAHPLSPDARSLLRTFYGCLASAVRYLHENKLRHKDIKPENVLVKSHEVYLTDFGTTLDWSDTGRDTTTGLASNVTLRYSAPEVATNLPRSASADIWSLGCVFLEIWTELCDHSASELVSFMESHGTKSNRYYANISAMINWCVILSSGTNNDANIPGPWIRSMLQVDASTRCSTQLLVEDIQTKDSESDISVSFSGVCCSGSSGVVTESVLSSAYQASMLKSNNPTAASSTISSRNTLALQEYFLKQNVTSSRLMVEETGRSLNSGRSRRESPIPRSEIKPPKKRNRLPETRPGQEPIETIHEEVEFARYADGLRDVDDKYSRSSFRHHVHQLQSTRLSSSIHDEEVSSLTLNNPPDILDEKVHRSDDLCPDVVTQQERTLRLRRRERRRETRNRLPMLHLSVSDDKPTVNEVLRQWLANFEPLTYRDIMTIKVLATIQVVATTQVSSEIDLSSTPPSMISMHELGDMSRIPELSCLHRTVVQAYDGSSAWKRIHTRMPDLSIQSIASNVVRNIWHMLDGLSIPWIECEGGIAYFYHEDILPIYDDSGTFEMQSRRSFELLSLKRYQSLQWWYDCLTAPQSTWYEKLKEIKTYKIEIKMPKNNRYVFRLAGLWQQHQISPDDLTRLSNTQRNIEAALGYGCVLRPIPWSPFYATKRATVSFFNRSN